MRNEMTDKKTEALKALEEIHPGNMTPIAEEAWNKAITAIREALAEQPAQQEPVAWMFTDKEGTEFFEQREDWEGRWTPLYTSPPATKSWVGLTDEEIEDAWPFSWRKHESVSHFAIYHAIEAKLKEKNT